MKTNINFPVRTYWVKASTVFLTCILFLSLPGCEKIKTPEELLIGTWNKISIHTSLYIGEHLEYEDTYNLDPNEGAIKFLEKGIGKLYQDGVVVDSYIWSENDLDGYLWQEGTFSWTIGEDNDILSDQWLIIGLLNSSGQYAPLYVSFTVNEHYLTLEYLSYERAYIIAKSIPDDGIKRRMYTVLRFSR